MPQKLGHGRLLVDTKVRFIKDYFGVAPDQPHKQLGMPLRPQRLVADKKRTGTQQNTAFAIGEYFGMSFIEADLATFAEEFGRTDCAGGCLGDLNGSDNDVDGSDLAAYASAVAGLCP